MPSCQGYRDVEFFKPDLKTNRKHSYEPIVLTRLYLHTKDNPDFGLDELRIGNPSKELPKHKVHWTAHVVIRNLDWLSEAGCNMLKTDLQMPLRRLELYVNRGEVEVLVRGRLSHIPQYMNSDDVPFGLRLQALMRPQNTPVRYNRSALMVNEDRYYVISSLHVRTYAKSQKFIDQYQFQHFIVEICKKARKNKTTREVATIQWLIQEYQSMWADAMKLGTVNGAPPKQCDILHHLALHVEYLNEWASHSGPIPTSIWRDFAFQVISARERAEQSNIRWGYFIEERVIIQEDDATPRRSQIPDRPTTPIQDDLEMPEQLVDKDDYTRSPTRILNESHMEMLDKLSLESDPIWKDVPREMQLPTHLPSSLIWKCPCPQPYSSLPCLFEIYLKKPSDKVRNWLSAEELNYLSPSNGEPKWDKRSRKLHNILIKAISHHFADDHLERSGIYIRDGSLTRIPPDLV